MLMIANEDLSVDSHFKVSVWCVSYEFRINDTLKCRNGSHHLFLSCNSSNGGWFSSSQSLMVFLLFTLSLVVLGLFNGTIIKSSACPYLRDIL